MKSTAAPLAIIGYACRYPGGVDDGPSFWKLLCEGRDAVREVPSDRWNAGAVFSGKPGVAGTSTSKWAGLLDQIDRFEPECFGISPREAAYIDPQQRLLLETAWEAVEHAGIPLESLAGSRTGVFVGISTGDYGDIQSALPDLRALSAFTAQGTAYCIAANRISYCFDLRGPSFIVDTACSSSLVALDRAAQSLQHGESDLAMVGGVNVIINASTFVSFSAASMLSPDGRCKAFDASANGFVRAEGAGVVLLKRLDDAVSAGDRIHAVLVATGVNQDGRTSGMAMPNGAAQEALLREVYARARIAPERMPYVEAHGTGTAIGDPTEAGALGRVFNAGGTRRAPLVIGSLKTNIGHLEAGAGIASLIKAVLMVEHRQIPPSLHFRTPNPGIPFAALGLRVPVQLEPWPDDEPALVGINSFGFGGTNAHAVVAEYRDRIDRAGTAPGFTAEDERDVPIVITARHANALRDLAEQWLPFLDEAERTGVALGDIAAHAARRRTHGAHVLGFAAANFEQARTMISAFLAEETADGHESRERPPHPPPLAFVFSGQGPQWHAMGRELLDTEPVFRQSMERCDALLHEAAGWSLLDELRKEEDKSRIQLTAFAQPALFALQVSLAALWKSWGITASIVLGHSVGEVAAAHVAGALSLETAVRLIARRGRSLQEHALPGRMLAVALSERDAQAVIDASRGRVGLCAINSPDMVTLGGPLDAIDALASDLAARGVWCRVLQVKHAFHTDLVQPAREAFLEGLTAPNEPLRCPMISTVTGRRVDDAALDTDYWWQNIRRPVRFADAVHAVRDIGIDGFIEIGPHPVLAAAIRQCRAGCSVPVSTWPSLVRGTPERRAMLSSLVGLFAAGARVEWSAVLPDTRADVALPRHPWTRQRYWNECAPSARLRTATDHHPLLGAASPGLHPRWQATLDLSDLTWLDDHRVGGRTLYPAAAFVEMALAAATRLLGSDACAIDDLRIERPLVLQDGRPVALEACADTGAAELRIASRAGEAGQPCLEHASASFRGLKASLAPVVFDASMWRARSKPIDASSLYQTYRGIGLEYGPAFQGIAEVKRAEGGALGRIALPDAAGTDAPYIVHPALLDACFQVLLAAIAPAERTGDVVYLPEHVDRIVLHRKPGRRVSSEARVVSTSRAAIAGDIRVWTDHGELAIEITGFRCRAAARPADHSRQPIRACISRTAWQHRPLGALRGGRTPLALRQGLAKLCAEAAAQSAGLLHDRTVQQVDAARAAGDRLAVAYVMRALRELCGGTRRSSTLVDVDALIASDGVRERSRAQVERFLEILADQGAARRLRGNAWRVTFAADDDDVDALWRDGLGTHPESYPLFRLVHLCGSQLTSLWSGKTDPLEVLFSREGVELLEQIYRDEEWTRYANALIARTVAAIVDRAPAHRVVRILEVGAGTGGTTAPVLDALPLGRIEYWFTDTSQFFLARAQERFQALPCMQYRLLDLELPFEDQGIPPGSFDIVVGADVLHAVHDLRATIARCRTALVHGGVLIARELTRTRIGLELIFGSMDGWWNYRGDPLRPTSGLLAPSRWASLLQGEGFGVPWVAANGGEATPFAAVMIAQARASAGATSAARAQLPGVAAPVERNWFVVGSGRAAQRIASWLRERGLRCIEVRPGAASTWEGPDCHGLDLSDPNGRQRLADIQHRDLGERYSLIDVCSLDRPTEAAGDSCVRLVHALQALASSTTNAPRRLMLLVDPAAEHAGALVGAGRTAANEFPAVGVRMVSLRTEDDRWLDHLGAEVMADASDEEVAWVGDDRFVPRLQPTDETRVARARTGRRTAIPFALVSARPGDLDSLHLREIDAIAPRPHEVEVEVHFGALNFRDVLRALGHFPTDDPRQLELGDECAGIVRRVGRDVRDLRPGDQVAVCHTGTFKSLLTVPAERVLKIPDGLDLQSAVSMPVAFLTADYALREVGRLAAGETVLIHAAAGGVGLAAMQVARRLGARILATAGSPAKRELVQRLGAERVMDSRSLAFFDEVMEATGGGGVDVVLNSLAGQAMLRSVACLAPGGRFLELGKRDLFDNTHVGLWPLRRNASYHAIDLSVLLTTEAGRSGALTDASRHVPQAMRFESLRAVFAAAATGEFTPLPVRVLPATRAAEAFRLMAQGGHIGKIVLDLTQHGARVKRKPRRPSFRREATYLVTGAFGGAGLMVARWLVDRGARHLALSSRRGPQSAAAHAHLEAFQQAGVDVRVFHCDVADASDVASMLDTISCDMPSLAGVFHLAMVLDDARMLNLDRERIARVLEPKLTGARNLHMRTRESTVDWFVLFGSVSASVGNPGQASYAAANAGLEQLARERRAAGLPAVTIGWGMLGDAGYVAERPELFESVAQSGLSPLTTDDVYEVLDIALASEDAAITAARVDWHRLWNRLGGHGSRANLLSALLSGSTGAGEAERGTSAAEEIAAADPADRPALIAEYVRRTAGRVLGMPAAKISKDRPLTEMGLDSLMGVELAAQTEAELGVTFPMSVLGQDLTIARIAETISRALGVTEPPSAAADGPKVAVSVE